MGERPTRRGSSSVKSALDILRWYRSRLASMSGPEVVHRTNEQAKRLVSRFFRPHFSISAWTETPLPVLPGLVDGVGDIARIPKVINSWKEAASRLQEGRVNFLGTDWPELNGSEKWHVDPISGRSWSSNTYCFRVPYRHARDYGDVKYVWELNRLQHLQPVAALAAVAEDPDLGKLCADELESWIDANQPFDGVNWATGIELALRVVSMIVLTSLIGEKSFSDSQKRKVLATLDAHGYWLMRYPSKFSSANNHLVAEAGGLYLLGTLMPGLKQSARYAQYGQQVLEEEAVRQICDDGVGAEQSPTYEAFVLEWLLLCAEVGNRIGKPFTDRYWQRIGKAGEFLRWISDAAGNQPRIGDDDEGRVFYFDAEPNRYVRTILGCVASATRRPDIAPTVVDMQLCHAIHGHSVPGSGSPTGTRQFAAGGYTVRRWVEKGTDNLLVIDHGALGFLSTAAHGHADALSVWLHANGRPILIDAGTYLYHSSGGWRDYFRGSGAHNTMVINGEDSSQMTGRFNWGRKACTKILSFSGAPDKWHWEAEHDGFVKNFGVHHRRRLEWEEPNTFVITDRLAGTGPSRSVEIGFLINPELQLSRVGASWIVKDNSSTLLAINSVVPFPDFDQSEGFQAERGWYSPRFGTKVPCDRLTLRGQMSIGAPVRTRFTISPS